MHRRDPVRSTQIPRSRFSFEVHPREDGRGSTPALLTEEYLRFGELGEAAFEQTPRACYRCQF